MKYNESKWKKDTSFSTIPIYNILNKSNEPFNLQQPKLDTLITPISDLSFPQSSNNENDIDIETGIINYDEDNNEIQTITEAMTENETFDEVISVFDTTAYYKYFITNWNKYVSSVVNINPINIFIKWMSMISINLFNIFDPPPNTNDYTLINSNMFNVFKILISFFITYNIFFVFFYKKVENISLFLKQITQYNDFIIFKYLLTPIKYVIYTLFYFVDKWKQMLNFIEINGNIPKNTHRKITFFVLFLISIYFSMRLINYVYISLLNSMQFNKDNANSNMVIIIILCAIFTLTVESTKEAINDSSFLPKDIQKYSSFLPKDIQKYSSFLPKDIQKYSSFLPKDIKEYEDEENDNKNIEQLSNKINIQDLFKNKNINTNIFNDKYLHKGGNPLIVAKASYTVIQILFVIIKFIILIMFSIMNSWFSVLLFCLLIFTITVFPMVFVYNIGIFEKFKEINNYCNGGDINDSENSNSNLNENANPIYDFFNWLVFNKIYSHLFEIVLIILFITQISEYYTNINNEILKIVLITICSFFITIFLVNIGVNTIYNVNIFDKYSTYILKGITILIFLILLYNYIDILFNTYLSNNIVIK